MTDLRQALAQPEQEQKTPLKVLNLTVFTENRLRNGRVYDVETLQAMTNRDILAIPDMGKKALAEVLEALNVHAVNMSQERVDETAKGEHDPVAWYGTDFEGNPTKFRLNYFAGSLPLYPAPPISDYHEGWEEGFKAAKREWVSLTEEEMKALKQKSIDDGMTRIVSDFEYIRAIEAKLKEKNK